MSARVDITEAQRAIIPGLLDKHLPNTAAWVYGSRAMGEAHPKSDLDMVVFSDPAQSRSVYDRKEALKRVTPRFAWTRSFGIPPPRASASASCPTASFSRRGTPRFLSGFRSIP
ncbi:MAG: nucleotidyltransferase domain-containing protein [Nitrospinae bacterium]|nr:nucleotidyltransferase domain-containing protein [Nitrospinota bacterium]